MSEFKKKIGVPRVKIRDFKRDINYWVSFLSYAYIFLFGFLLLHLLLLLNLSASSSASPPSPQPRCLLLSSFVWRGAVFILTTFQLYLVWCYFLFSLVFICIFFVHCFSGVRLAPFSASSMFVWCAQASICKRLGIS